VHGVSPVIGVGWPRRRALAPGLAVCRYGFVDLLNMAVKLQFGQD
jgi:hypothetical protein